MTTCHGCKALDHANDYGPHFCPAGVEVVKVIHNGRQTKRPKNDCEGCATDNQFIELKQANAT